jgi:hypothetical protein
LRVYLEREQRQVREALDFGRQSREQIVLQPQDLERLQLANCGWELSQPILEDTELRQLFEAGDVGGHLVEFVLIEPEDTDVPEHGVGVNDFGELANAEPAIVELESLASELCALLHQLHLSYAWWVRTRA